ncbi:MAG: heme NO-binding domain-containing protein [Myxococcales bacterium]|nr:heme NO-binding domain-containing protein [Myxococcales bacterium]
MIGLIHKVLFGAVEALGGEQAVAAVRERAGVSPEQEFRLNATYDDTECGRLFAATGEVLDLGPEEVIEIYADAFLQDSRDRWPMWFKMSQNSKELLQRQPQIHNSLAAGLKNDEERRRIADKFQIDIGDRVIVTHYRSSNHLCKLYMALVRRVVALYGDVATIEEPVCMQEGHDECQIRIEWSRLGEAG